MLDRLAKSREHILSDIVRINSNASLESYKKSMQTTLFALKVGIPVMNLPYLADQQPLNKKKIVMIINFCGWRFLDYRIRHNDQL